MTIHIPPEVKQACRVALKNHFGSDYSDETLDGITDAVLTAALKAWPGATREVRQGFSFMPNELPKRYEVLIIRTEAPRT